jgi:4-hydroxy-3-polyprenylbenzoate decarboxylase
LLERIDYRTDLHFQTRTTIDTLDYTGSGFNQGSKVVLAAAGPRRRTLPTTIPGGIHVPNGFSDPQVCMPGVLAVQAPPYPKTRQSPALDIERFCQSFRPADPITAFPLILLVDDSEFTAASLKNWVWVTFTRSNPASDLYGIASFTEEKHWGCNGSLVIDARIKPYHAPPLIEDARISERVERFAVSGGPLHGIL